MEIKGYRKDTVNLPEGQRTGTGYWRTIKLYIRPLAKLIGPLLLLKKLEGYWRNTSRISNNLFFPSTIPLSPYLPRKNRKIQGLLEGYWREDGRDTGVMLGNTRYYNLSHEKRSDRLIALRKNKKIKKKIGCLIRLPTG